jgi:tripartite-type tricarboxylate transporter receptor subunit TctC
MPIKLASRSRSLMGAAVATWVAASVMTVHAQDAWPAKAVKIVVPSTAGSTPDRLTRMFAERLAKKWGQPVIVDNKAGATTMIGGDIVAKAAPDGYTLLSAFTPFVQVPALFKKVPYDAERDFIPIIQTVESEVIFVVRADSPFRTMRDFIAAAKVPGAGMSYGSFGSGSTFHIYGETLKKSTGMPLIHVPYKGEVPALTDLLGGQLTSTFASVGTSLGFLRSGRLRALGIVATKRSKIVPDVPTFVELGAPPPNVAGWFGFLAPAGTPASVVRKIAADVRETLDQPDVVATLREQGLEPIATTPEAFKDRIRHDLSEWKKLLAEVGIDPAD